MLLPTDNGAYVVLHRLGLTTGAPGPYRFYTWSDASLMCPHCSLALVIADDSETRRSHE